jgi:hypothetical protein
MMSMRNEQFLNLCASSTAGGNGFQERQKFNMNLARGPLDFAVLFAVHHHP